MDIGVHRFWKYLWLLDPAWRNTTASILSAWIEKRNDRRALIIRSQHVLQDPTVLASDIANAFKLLPVSPVSGSGGVFALETHTPDNRLFVLQTSKGFLAGPDGTVTPKWGTPNNDQHQFVPNFGVALGMRIGES
jgi:hypothetical protein